MINLTDDELVTIDYDVRYSAGGCDTCDYGSFYLHSLTFEFLKKRLNVETKDNILSEGWLMKLVVCNIEKIQQFNQQEFCDWIKMNINEFTNKNVSYYEYEVK